MGIERVELHQDQGGHYAAIGVTTLGSRDATFTAHLVDGGTFEAVTDHATYRHLQSLL